MFYTDEYLTRFISQEALILFVNSKLNEKSLNLVKIQNTNEILKLDIEIQQKLANILLNLTICDPACGSGGFLLNAADIIFNLVTKLNPEKTRFDIKKQLLKNLY